MMSNTYFNSIGIFFVRLFDITYKSDKGIFFFNAFNMLYFLLSLEVETFASKTADEPHLISSSKNLPFIWKL